MKVMNKPKRKKCKQCEKLFQPLRQMQPCCSPECAVKYVKDKDNRKKVVEKAQKDDRKETKAKLRQLGRSDRSKALRAAQKAFNNFIRARDEGLACVSCGRSSGCKVNAGHYLSTKAHPELRFDEKNVHLQCEHCNCHLSGNQVNYRKGLIERFGVEVVDYLEGPHELKKYTVDELWDIEKQYKQKLKELQSD